MRTNNKMDFEVEFAKWWEVVKEYFTKELEKNLTQHRNDERILKYKLEAYQKNFVNFIYNIQQVHRYQARTKRQK